MAGGCTGRVDSAELTLRGLRASVAAAGRRLRMCRDRATALCPSARGALVDAVVAGRLQLKAKAPAATARALQLLTDALTPHARWGLQLRGGPAYDTRNHYVKLCTAKGGSFGATLSLARLIHARALVAAGDLAAALLASRSVASSLSPHGCGTCM